MSGKANTDEPWSLRGKTALVTGGSRGIGRGIAVHLTRKGLENIAITYVSNKSAAEDTLGQCRALGAKKTLAIQADLADASIWQDVIHQTLRGLDTATIDILVNNAVKGSFKDFKRADETTAESFSEMMLANVYTPVATTVAFMRHAAPKYGGRVINISSVTGKQGNGEPLFTYGAGKAALESYTRSFAATYASDTGITFNSVVVGPTATEALRNTMESFPPEFKEQQIALTSAAPRMAEVEDVAYVVGFLASEEGRWVNGAAVSANGGYRTVISALG